MNAFDIAVDAAMTSIAEIRAARLELQQHLSCMTEKRRHAVVDIEWKPARVRLFEALNGPSSKSARQLAVESGMSVGNVHRLLNPLLKKGVVRMHELQNHHGGNPTRVFRADRWLEVPTRPEPRTRGGSGSEAARANRAVLAALLSDEPQTIADLVHVTHLRRTTLQRHIVWLAGHGMAERGPDRISGGRRTRTWCRPGSEHAVKSLVSRATMTADASVSFTFQASGTPEQLAELQAMLRHAIDQWHATVPMARVITDDELADRRSP